MLVEGFELVDDAFPPSVLTEVDDLGKLEARAGLATIRKAHGCSLSPHLEAWVGTLSTDPQDAFQHLAPFCEVTLLVTAIEAQLKPAGCRLIHFQRHLQRLAGGLPAP